VTAKRSKERVAPPSEHSVALNTDSHGAASAEEKLARQGCEMLIMLWLDVKYNYFQIISAFVDIRLK